MSSRAIAAMRTRATSVSPSTPAAARAGSGRDQNEVVPVSDAASAAVAIESPC
jgi:hypothetical protein